MANDVRDELPGAGTGKRLLLGPGVEVVQELGAHLDEEQHLRGDAAPRPPGAPVGGVHPHLEVHEARSERRRHPVHHPAVALAVAAGDEGRALGQLVLPAAPVEHELVERGLHHRDRRGQLLEVHQPAPLGVARGQERRRRPAGAPVRVAPRNAPKVHRIEQQRAHVEVGALRGRGDLSGDLGLGAPGRPPDDDRLPGLDEPREGVGERARAKRVVGGDGGVGHGRLLGVGDAKGRPAGTADLERGRDAAQERAGDA